MKLIVGLGNPGKEYVGTRHNAGFAVVDAFAREHGLPAWKGVKKVKGAVTRGKVAEEEVILLKPDTFMNASGDAVAGALSFYKAGTADLVVVHDDAAFPVGMVRIAASGSGGGHNGVDSVIAAIGTQGFVRLRVGIGPTDGSPVHLDTFVLSRFAAGEAASIADGIQSTVRALDTLLTEGLAKAMQKVHRGK